MKFSCLVVVMNYLTLQIEKTKKDIEEAAVLANPTMNMYLLRIIAYYKFFQRTLQKSQCTHSCSPFPVDPSVFDAL